MAAITAIIGYTLLTAFSLGSSVAISEVYFKRGTAEANNQYNRSVLDQQKIMDKQMLDMKNMDVQTKYDIQRMNDPRSTSSPRSI